MSDFARSPALNTIPIKKLQAAISAVEDSTDTLDIKAIKLSAINRYYESNIPINYWGLKMERDFVGDPRLKQKYDEYVSDLKATYINGTSICFAGNHGVGKSLASTCILKKACQKGYSCLYADLSNIVSVLVSGGKEDKSLARRELVLVDFLVIDEFDSRFFKKSADAADLYAQTLEGVFRTRSQNKLPTIMCTNSPNVLESFNGPLKDSISSLMSGYVQIFTVMGQDYRKMGQ
jgi:DNA replication protein DnaC